jgi:antitoxin (DNA-binding transcriptional repressor) of toxin-antitoxin stability system
MAVVDPHVVGLRDLRHRTSEVLARVRHGETVDVTDHGRLIARRPGYRPRMRPGDGTDGLSNALAALRDEEPW